MVWQLLKVDESTRVQMGATIPLNFHSLGCALDQPWLFEIDPTVFTHAYMLLGTHPSRFGHDLTLYLATAKTFFDRNPNQQLLQIPDAGQDAKKRLSEDLGVAVASCFMVDALNVQWDTISQIPQNSNLAKKRPDFFGFTDTGERHIFESKGTTVPSSVAKALGNAIEQVKGYPDTALLKLAIVSFFSTDSRVFDSATFVVDPIFPEFAPPDERVSKLLHAEKTLQLGGFSLGASEYLKVLRLVLKTDTDQPITFKHRRKFVAFREVMDTEYNTSIKKDFENGTYCGQTLISKIGKQKIQIFLGVNEDVIAAIKSLGIETEMPKFDSFRNDTTSYFSDGTLVDIQIERNVS